MKRRNSTYQPLTRFRVIVQIGVILFFLALPLLHGIGARWVVGNLYALTIGPVRMVDPLMALQSVLLTGTAAGILLMACLIPVALAFIFGKVFCSWICPYNSISEGLDWLLEGISRQRKKARRRRMVANPHPWGYWGVFGGLLFFMIITVVPVMSFLSMPGLLSSQISQTVEGVGPGLELALVAGLLVSETVFSRRIWCRSLCPVGALLGIFRLPPTLKVQYNKTDCHCTGKRSPCEMACPLHLSPRDKNLYPACFQCGLCLKACETTGSSALGFRWGTSAMQSEST